MTRDEFDVKLKKLCDGNWKAKGIMKANGNNFNNLPDYQQEMFIKTMGLKRKTTEEFFEVCEENPNE